mmetsp:Transcript_4477/g.8117  ORF Transcript_4477/g.8117 Transcript_4477/m.8117 type:complete len:259 (+) Transcript_4477:101-877(+)
MMIKQVRPIVAACFLSSIVSIAASESKGADNEQIRSIDVTSKATMTLNKPSPAPGKANMILSDAPAPAPVPLVRKEAVSLVEEGLGEYHSASGAPGTDNLDLAPAPSNARCNSYPLADAPSSDYYLKRNADELECASDVCNGVTDAAQCCKFVKRLKTNYKCQGSMALNWFAGWTYAQCIDHAINNGWKFFLFGKMGSKIDKTGRCWWQRTSASTDCEDPDDGTNTTVGCCECSNKPAGSCWWNEDDAYDFYKVSEPA